jgi:hypothetical protein
MAVVSVVAVMLMTAAASGTMWDVYAGDNIQTVINGAGANDTITIHAGSYGQQVAIPSSKSGLILQGDGSYPLLNPALGTTTYATVITVQAANVTIRGLGISSSTGLQVSGGRVIEQHGIWDGSWTVGPSGLTVDGVKIQDVAHGVRSYGNNLTVTNCEMKGLGRSGVHASGPDGTPLSMTVRNNWFHDWGTYDKEGAAVYTKYNGRYGDVSYNYISGMRMGLAYYYGGPNDAADALGEIRFTHNTVDMDYDLGSGPIDMTMGMSFYGTGENADGTVVRDNIFANAKWYALYQEGEVISGGAILIDNNLFYNNNNFYWPDNQYPNQWFGDETKALAGWYDGPEDGFTFTDNITAQDPMFVLAGAEADEFWALLVGSPALLAASDGTNIGAYQGLGVPEPATLSLLAVGGVLALLRRRSK